MILYAQRSQGSSIQRDWFITFIIQFDELDSFLDFILNLLPQIHASSSWIYLHHNTLFPFRRILLDGFQFQESYFDQSPIHYTQFVKLFAVSL